MADAAAQKTADIAATRDAERRINQALERARRFRAEVQIPPLEQAATLDVLARLMIDKGLVTEDRFVRMRVERMADALEAAISEIAAQAIMAPGIPQAQ